ncbi:hypothetical protein BTH_I2764 [Burkholderia thailandensis E264]|uniref:Uncharacterized protein n=1 Tax=Burkholderia thailandensis (strain ATCC 700388 / DSM 13276 / CCUG 48851 / CIP 106301 / E264) TaxID=271848 RepID=Q2SUX3_BURTA|nr:hypothetical protein BTH_I2764 [Burkholderia thailandensis E264]
MHVAVSAPTYDGLPAAPDRPTRGPSRRKGLPGPAPRRRRYGRLGLRTSRTGPAR